jgi:hypothetical protein
MEKRHYTFRPKYHLTPIENITEVKAYGLLTSRDHRGCGRVWLCDFDKIEYVAYHLLDVRGLTYCQYMVYSVRWWALPASPRSAGRTGIYYSLVDISPHLLDQEFRFVADKFPLHGAPGA